MLLREGIGFPKKALYSLTDYANDDKQSF